MDTTMVFITGIIYGPYVHAPYAGENDLMSDDPLDAVYAYVERAYLRLQAGDILLRCLEEGNSSPMRQMVEGLVLAGPNSLGVLREMLTETNRQKAQAVDDLYRVYNEFEDSLRSYGVRLVGIKSARAAAHLSAVRFLKILRDQDILEEKNQVACLQILKNSRELLKSLDGNIRLLEEIEIYLEDWMWGLVYQSARQESNEASFSC
jgi:hypothetical protein